MLFLVYRVPGACPSNRSTRLLFEKMLGYANRVGLYSEQLGPNGQHLGTSPHAITHLALISAAGYLDRVLSGHQQKECG
jgi:GH15 family glucan-1,4-alpha-glucosidase